MKQNPLRWPALFAGLALTASAKINAQVYKVGDLVSNFSYFNRATGQPVNLVDYASKVVVIEWFAYWCPFCRAAAPEIEREVIQYYRNLGGTAEGIQVVKLGCNVQPDTGSNKAQTDAFVAANGFPVVINDTHPARALQARFTPTSGQPSFAIINGVADAVDRQTGKPIKQWELLYSRFGYGSTRQPIAQFRTAIERVKLMPPAEPVVLNGLRFNSGTVSFLISGSPRASLTVQSSSDGIHWIPSTTEVPAYPPTPFVEAADGGQRFYRVTRSVGF